MILSEQYIELLRSRFAGVRRGPLESWDIFMQEGGVRAEARELERMKKAFGWETDLDFEALLQQEVLVVTSLSREILWVSSGFYEMTGYVPSEVKGKKPSFLQGKETSREVVARISAQLGRFEPVTDTLVNYRKNGEPYLCRIDIRPLGGADGTVSHFIGIERSIPF